MLLHHYAVYLAEVGCKRSAAANVETVFSGAGKFMEEASSAGHVQLLRRMIKLHYNWKYFFIRPTVEEVCARYLAKHGGRAKVCGRPAPRPQRPSPRARGPAAEEGAGA